MVNLKNLDKSYLSKLIGSNLLRLISICQKNAEDQANQELI